MSNADANQNQGNTIFSVQVSKLEKSPLNARKTVSKAACEEMKASIMAHGLMQNLIVTEGEKGKYQVVAGARRTEALKALIAEGKLPADHEVLCQVVSDEKAYEMSLAENTVRHAMHPADEFAAYTVLVNSQQTVEAIAQRFGKTAKYVQQRLKLGRAAPELIQAYKAGEVTLETLEAYTVSDDRKRQLAVFNSVKGNRWENNDPRHIRKQLTEQMVNAKNKLAMFVGLESYENAGGPVRRDLFGDDVYLENPELLRRLAEEKLTAAAEESKAEGWAWVTMAAERDYSFIDSCGEIEPQPIGAPKKLTDLKAKLEAEYEEAEQAYYDDEGEDDAVTEELRKRSQDLETKLEEVNEKLASFIAYDPEQMKIAGCYLYIDHDGTLEIEKGLVKPEDKKAAAKPGAPDAEEGDEQPEPQEKGLPQSLLRDLEAYRLGAAQAELSKHPNLAYDLLVFKAAKSVFGISRVYDGPNVSFTRNYGGTASADAKKFVDEQMEQAKCSLELAWMELESEVEQFAAFQRLFDYQKSPILAFCVASTLQPKLAPAPDREKAYDLVLAQTGANVASYWRPNAANFLSRVSSEQLLAIGDEIFGNGWSNNRRKAKKSALVSELDKAFSQPDKALDPEKVQKLMNWLPAGMAFGEAEPPASESKPKKGRKAA